MRRVTVSIPDADYRWLRSRAKLDGKSVSELVRTSVRALRARSEPTPTDWERLHELTAGMWRNGDGLEWQRRLRREW